MMDWKKNQIFTAEIEGYSSEGHGVCRLDGRAVFVPRALAGELWRIRLVKVTSSVVYARGEELLRASPERRASDCPFFGKCGGCDLWHMSYEEELRFKLTRVNDALTRIGKQSFSVTEILGAETITRYRNKGIFAVAEQNALPCSGFYKERSHELIPVDRCLIQNELSERAAAAVIAFMRANGVSAYDEASGKGVVRHVFCRKALRSEDAVVCLVAARGLGSRTAALVSALRTVCPELTGIVLNINKSSGNTVLTGDFYTLWGRETVRDVLCGYEFSIAPQAFFQINPAQTEKLYRRALRYAAPGQGSLLLDLYCGAGTISLCLAGHAAKVIGAEIVPEAVENARSNALANRIQNVEFICADAAQAAEELAARGLKPETVVVDPPRKGMSEQAVEAVASMMPDRIVYVSCDPGTLARDILRYSGLGYVLQDATAVDMFPRTRHVETVALLQRKDAPHHMDLEPAPFAMMTTGKKTIELRLFDQKRQRIKVGDEISFTNKATGESLRTWVLRLHRFDTFGALYQTLPLLQCGYTEETLAQADPSDMEQYYSLEEQKQYGVVGIELIRCPEADSVPPLTKSSGNDA